MLLRVAPRFGYVVGVDVGETRVQVELFDLAMTALAKADYGLGSPTPEPDAVASFVLDGLRSVLTQAGVAPGEVLGLGVGVSGVVERSADAVVHAQTLGWDAVPLGAMLRAGTDLPIQVDNGAKALGQAEMWFGAGRGARHAVIALVGSGVGALLAAAESSKTAAKVLEDTVGYLGAGIATLVNLFNPERIVLGGWAGLALGGRFLPQIREATARHALRQPYAHTAIELCELGPDAVAMGAATLPVARLLADGGIRRP